ncbi:uncharacterized protein NPIL_293501 [Nephila pilipes]|uniref:Uncharacterized protein n=1 Tax=Nephila pilipes TaxID=299642 RepID=A0A8X6TS15_NEPPI|nr:uncharacterized protein NPIL_293501 [Nephila pilipes]
MASRLQVVLFHLFLLSIILWWCFVHEVECARPGKKKLPYKAGSWKTFTAGLDESSILLMSCGAILFIGWIAHKASNEEMPMKMAFPIVSLGGVIIYFGSSAAINLLFGKR